MPKGSKAALWNLAFLLGLEGRRAYFSTNSPKCILRDLGPSGGVPSAAFLCYAEKPGPPLCNTMCCTHCFPRTLLYCSHCGENVGIQGITIFSQTRQSGGCGSAVENRKQYRSATATIPHNSASVFSERFCVRKSQFSAGILCVFQGKLAHFWHKRSAEDRRRSVKVLSKKNKTCVFFSFSWKPKYASIIP